MLEDVRHLLLCLPNIEQDAAWAWCSLEAGYHVGVLWDSSGPCIFVCDSFFFEQCLHKHEVMEWCMVCIDCSSLSEVGKGFSLRINDCECDPRLLIECQLLSNCIAYLECLLYTIPLHNSNANGDYVKLDVPISTKKTCAVTRWYSSH